MPHSPDPARPTASSFAADPLATQMLRMLSRLSRRGAWLERNPSGDRYSLKVPDLQRHRRREKTGGDPFSVASIVVEDALHEGWIAADISGTGWRLTEHGAIALHGGIGPPLQKPLPVERAPRPRATVAKGGRKKRSGPQAEAAERLSTDFLNGQMMPRVTSNWDRAALGAIPDGGRNPSGRGTDVSERASAAQERFRHAIADVGPEFADLLIDHCCLDIGLETIERRRGWPQRSAKVALGLALDRLARHYGTVGEGPRAGRTQHWGVRDYRPTLQRWSGDGRAAPH